MTRACAGWPLKHTPGCACMHVKLQVEQVIASLPQASCRRTSLRTPYECRGNRGQASLTICSWLYRVERMRTSMAAAQIHSISSLPLAGGGHSSAPIASSPHLQHNSRMPGLTRETCIRFWSSCSHYGTTSTQTTGNGGSLIRRTPTPQLGLAEVTADSVVKFGAVVEIDDQTAWNTATGPAPRFERVQFRWPSHQRPNLESR